jgi:hypothetical protein
VTKDQRILALDQVPIVFSDAQVRQFAAKAKLPADTNLTRFAAAIRDAAMIYVRDAGTPDGNAVHHEIKALYSAASRHRYKEAAERIEALSQQTRDFINRRAERPNVPWQIPAADTLRDKATREAACQTIINLLSQGGRWREGRRRTGGERSMVWEPKLYAPTLQKRPPKRKAERDFVMWLQIAFLDATEQSPPHTAHHVNPGPFARMVKTCMRLIAPAADTVKIINELQRQRREKKKQRDR